MVCHAESMRALRPMFRPFARGSIAVVLGLGAVAGGLAGCGGSEAKIPPALDRATVERALGTTPPGLSDAERSLDRAAGTLLPGDGKQAAEQLKRQLAALKGTPVVVNLWGEWCAPCKKELPVFQRATLELRGRVAFLGIATRTTRSKTESFLNERYALPYPSIFDPDEQVNTATGVNAIPKTLFYKAAGGKPFVHLGPYYSVTKLRKDIARYAS